MEIKQITNKKEWEGFVLQQPYTLFVQSYHYGEFYESMDEKSWIFGIYDNEKLIGGSLVVSTHAKRGNFLYLPYGPVGDIDWKNFFIFLKKFAKKNRFDFIRVSPFIDDSEVNRKAYLKDYGFRTAPIHVLAETTWMLNLESNEEEIFQKMGKNHRYLIKRCLKEGVKIEMVTATEEIERFNKLHDETAKRHKFFRFTKDYIFQEFSNFTKQGQSVIFNAYLPDGRIDSSAVIIYYGNMAVYRHGASLNLNGKISTSYLIQWEAIKEAKRRGMHWYNFWGVAPSNSSSRHPFRGLTHFKKGFGGIQKDLLHCQDLPISNKYWLNWTIETLRRINRGF